MVNLLIAALMAVSVLFGGGAAAAHASQDALPGDVLYPVKTVVEQTELTFTTDPVAKAELHLEFAQERVAEMQALAAQGQIDRIPDVAVNMQEHLQEAETIARQLAQQGQDDAAARVAVMSQVAVQMLQQVMHQAPPEARAALEAAVRHAEQTEKEATQEKRQTGQHAFFHLQGAVERMDGDTWIVNGQTVIVPNDARIAGDVQVGGVVSIHGYVDPQGRQVAVQVVSGSEKKAESIVVRFMGTVDAIEDGTWTINGQQITVTEETEIKGDIQVGDVVWVKALVSSDGTFIAKEIKRVNAPASVSRHHMVSFQGIVEAQNGNQWIVGGKTVNITEDTRMHGQPQIGDLVMVVAEPKEDGTFTAKVITLIARGQRNGGGEGYPTMPPMPSGDHEGGHGDHQPIMTPMPTMPWPTVMPTMPWGGGDHDGGQEGGNH